MKILSGVIPAGVLRRVDRVQGRAPVLRFRAGGRRRGDRLGAPGAARRRPPVDRGEHVREQLAGALRTLRRADGGEMGERGARRLRPARRSAGPQLVAYAFRATPDRAGRGAPPLRTPPDPGRADRRPDGRRGGRAHRAVAAHPGLGGGHRLHHASSRRARQDRRPRAGPSQRRGGGELRLRASQKRAGQGHARGHAPVDTGARRRGSVRPHRRARAPDRELLGVCRPGAAAPAGLERQPSGLPRRDRGALRAGRGWVEPSSPGLYSACGPAR